MLQTSIDLMKENCFMLKKARSRWYPAQTIMNTDNTDDIVQLANTHTQAKSLLHCLVKAAGSIGLHINGNKTEYMYFNQNQTRDISTLTGSSLKLVDKFTCLRSSVSSSNVISMQLSKAWSAIDRLSVIWISDL